MIGFSNTYTTAYGRYLYVTLILTSKRNFPSLPPPFPRQKIHRCYGIGKKKVDNSVTTADPIFSRIIFISYTDECKDDVVEEKC